MFWPVVALLVQGATVAHVAGQSPAPAPVADRSAPAPADDASRGVSDDPVNRVEIRFYAYPPPAFSSETAANGIHTRDAELGLATDYLRLVRRNFAVGVSAASLVRSDATWIDADHNNVADPDRPRAWTSYSTTFIYGVVRWNFARGVPSRRLVEPYVTGSAGPVFRWNQHTVTVYNTRQERVSSEKTGFGGRIAAGVDLRLGPVLTLGAVGAWNWSTCEDESYGFGPEDRGGEVSATLGFVWGVPAKGRKPQPGAVPPARGGGVGR